MHQDFNAYADSLNAFLHQQRMPMRPESIKLPDQRFGIGCVLNLEGKDVLVFRLDHGRKSQSAAFLQFGIVCGTDRCRNRNSASGGDFEGLSLIEGEFEMRL